jgi:hypothetical protein
MNRQTAHDEIAATPIGTLWMRLFKIGRKEPADSENRAEPLTNDYNSTFIIVVLSIAAILAVILLLWI